MKRISVLIVLLLAAVVTFACGGEKQEESPMTEQPPIQTQQVGTSSGFAWETLPAFPGAVSTRARVMPGNRGYKKFEIRVFSSQEDARNILDFYKKGVPEEDWAFAEETKLDNGLQGSWESKTGEATVWVRVTKSRTTDGNDIEIIYGKKE